MTLNPSSTNNIFSTNIGNAHKKPAYTIGKNPNNSNNNQNPINNVSFDDAAQLFKTQRKTIIV